MNLYDLNIQFQNIMQTLESDELTDAEFDNICQEYELTCDQIEQKIDSVAKVARNLKAEIEAVKAEKTRLAARQSALEHNAEKLKLLVENTMINLGVKKFKTTAGNYTIQKFPPSLTVTDIAKIPERFLAPQPPKVDAKAMIAEWKETGEIFDGVEIGQREGVVFK